MTQNDGYSQRKGEAAPLSEPRHAPLAMDAETFRTLGHRLVDQIANMLEGLPQRVVTPGEAPAQVRAALGASSLPERGDDAAAILDRAQSLLAKHSLFNGHPRFFGYITSSPAPIGILGDLLAAAINPNIGAWELSPLATEIELQTCRWIAELIGYPGNAGGVLVSGGNMANFVCFLAARHAKAPWDIRVSGPSPDGKKLCVYGSKETHTWIQKAADLFGLGTDSIRWIPTDASFAMDVSALRAAIAEDKKAGAVPFLVVGTAGSVGTGAIDPLREIAAICKQENLWFHVDGAYGALAAALPDADPDLRALALADSVAVDPHKWLYSPLEAGCALVRDRNAMSAAFSYRTPYYFFGTEEEEHGTNMVDYGLQNSRGFRALKVWLGLQQAGREGVVQMIEDDIRLARELHERAAAHPEIETFVQGLSISTFRYVPKDLRGRGGEADEYLDRLNTALNMKIKRGGKAFITCTVLNGRFVLRACIVNFRTQLSDVRAVPEIVAEAGRELDRELRPAEMARR